MNTLVNRPLTAHDILRNPHVVDCQPALLQDAWVRAKEARGQTVRTERLSVVSHIIVPNAPTLGEMLYGAAEAMRPRIREAISRRTGPDGPEAA